MSPIDVWWRGGQYREGPDPREHIGRVQTPKQGIGMFVDIYLQAFERWQGLEKFGCGRF
jgi:hypothetical protein